MSNKFEYNIYCSTRAYSSVGPEPAAHNRLVVGSNPTRPTNILKI